MKLIDICVDKLCETKLFEMAFERKTVIRTVENLTFQIGSHLIKVIWFSNSPEVEHWKTELNAWLNDIQYTRFNNFKLLSGDKYYDILFRGYFTPNGSQQVNMMIDGMIKSKRVDPQRQNTRSLLQNFEIMEKVYHELAYTLAAGKFITIDDILNKYTS